MEKLSMIQALRKVGIDRHEGQKLPEFAAELKKLSDADRAWFAERFAVEYGIEIVLTPNQQAA